MGKKRIRTDIDTGTSWAIIFLYLLSSFFGALIFSILALRAKKRNRTSFWWILLSVIFIVIFGTISYSLVITSSPSKDAFWFYLGISTIAANTFAIIINILALAAKPAE